MIKPDHIFLNLTPGETTGYFPLTEDQVKILVTELSQDPNYYLQKKKDNVYLFSRVQNPK